MLYRFGRRLLGPFFRGMYRMKIQGRQHIPQEGKLILCCNHQSLLDPCLLSIAVPKRQVYYMAKSELFENHGKWFGGLLRRLGAFPVRRDTGDTSSMRRARELLEEGKILGIFPQGRCVKNGVPFQPKAGAAVIAAKTGADILPACIYSQGKIRLFRRVTVRFGPVIPFSQMEESLHTRAGMKQAAGLLAQRINGLLEEKY